MLLQVMFSAIAWKITSRANALIPVQHFGTQCTNTSCRLGLNLECVLCSVQCGKSSALHERVGHGVQYSIPKSLII